MKPTTMCTCNEPGWCDRHQCRKDRGSFERCRRQPEWFAMWESGYGRAEAGGCECIHRGDVLHMAACQGCKGDVSIKVFGCEIFGQCTLRKHTEVEQDCSSCTWRRSS